jgi:hypothetical protein
MSSMFESRIAKRPKSEEISPRKQVNLLPVDWQVQQRSVAQRSFAQKIILQMNCKLGGELGPLKICYFYFCRKNKKL